MGLLDLFSSGYVVPDGGFGLDYSPAALDFVPGGATNYVGDLPLNDYNYVGDLPLAGEPTVTLQDLYSSMDREQYQPTDYGNLYKGVTGLDGSVLGASAALANTGNVAKLMSDLARATGGGGGSDDGGGKFGFNMPRIESPVADRISAVQPGPLTQYPIPQTPAPQNTFKPVVPEMPRPAPDEGGLARLFAAALRGAR